jgi:mRNA interferase RelE/StbE
MEKRRYRIEYGATAQGEIQQLPQRIRTQILRKIQRLEQGLHGDIKRLRAANVAYRLRSGEFRILFDVAGDTILIRRVGIRRDIYD